MSSPDSIPALSTSLEPAERSPEPFASMHDLKCPVTILLGTTNITVSQCLELKPDSLVVLRQAAGSDLELRVNGVLLARGEVVIVEHAASFRVTTVDVSGDAEF